MPARPAKPKCHCGAPATVIAYDYGGGAPSFFCHPCRDFFNAFGCRPRVFKQENRGDPS